MIWKRAMASLLMPAFVLLGPNQQLRTAEQVEASYVPSVTVIQEHKSVELVDEDLSNSKYSDEIPLDKELQEFIYDQCQKYGIDQSVVYGIMYHESRFQPDVVSPTNDYGLMQINEINHQWLSEHFGRYMNYLDPYDNAEAGIYLLSVYTRDTLVDTLMCYSLGDAGAARARSKGIYQTECVGEILDDINKFKVLLGDN